MTNPLLLSIVVPTRNSAASLDRALTAILGTDLPRADYELIVVDDSSADSSLAIAARYADTVVRLTGRSAGPAYARNRGAELARGQILAFVDPDVVVRHDTLSRLVRAIVQEPGCDAVSASLEDAGPWGNFISHYWNLLRQFGERRAPGSLSHFGAECAAIKRDVLLSSGMYDEWRFDKPSLEGVELGQRLCRTGHRVIHSTGIRVTIRKQWDFLSLCGEVWNRSLKLARSLGYQSVNRGVPAEVVLTLTRPLVPALAVLGIVAVSASFGPHINWKAKAALVVGGLLFNNLPVQRFYARERGLLFASLTAPVHLLMQVISGIALFTGWVLRDAVGDSLPDAATQAYAEVGAETWPPVPRRL